MQVAPSPGRRLLLLLIFQSGVTLLALCCLWIWQPHWLLWIDCSPRAIGYAVVLTCPQLLVAWGLVQLPFRWARQLTRRSQAIVRHVFAQFSPWQLLLVSVAAGVSEELLFRGCLQTAVRHFLGPFAAVIVASVAFAIAHGVRTSLPFTLYLTTAGVYLGWIWESTGNLLIPMVTHALYDFCVLTWMTTNMSKATWVADSPGEWKSD